MVGAGGENRLTTDRKNDGDDGRPPEDDYYRLRRLTEGGRE